MIYGDDSEELQLKRIGELLGIAKATGQLDGDEQIQVDVQLGVPSEKTMLVGARALQIQVFRVPCGSFFARPVPLIFYSSLDWGKCKLAEGSYRGPPKPKKNE